MKIQEAIVSELKKAKTVAIMSHKGGDGDSFGAECGLKLALERMGKKVTLFSDSPLPEALDYFYNFGNFEFVTEYVSVDLLLILDVSAKNRIVFPKVFEEYKKNGTRTIVIDHHFDAGLSEEVDLALIDQNTCSTCEIVYDILEKLGVVFDKAIGTLILTGIETDTSSFQNQNTNEKCYVIASTLLAKGARLSLISKEVSSYSVESLKLFGLAINRLKMDKKNGLAVTYLTYKDAEELGVSTEQFEDIVNFLNQVQGASIIVVLKQIRPGEVKVSLRTRSERVDVAKIAKMFGGGGHEKASGFMVKGDIVEEKGKISVV